MNFSRRPVKKDGVEDAERHVGYLRRFDGEFERIGSSVHRLSDELAREKRRDVTVQ